MNIEEANSDLLGKTYSIPLNVKQFLQSMMNSVGEGKQRIQNLLSNPNPTYEQIKRFKHDIEHSYQGDWSIVLNWINSVLGTDRGSIYNKKKNTMDTGMQNRFIKPHEKDSVIGFGSLRENKKVIKITEQQQELLKKEILSESDDYSRYKASVLREILSVKEQQLANLNQEVDSIKQLIQAKTKVRQPVESSPNNELSHDVDLVAPPLE